MRLGIKPEADRLETRGSFLWQGCCLSYQKKTRQINEILVTLFGPGGPRGKLRILANEFGPIRNRSAYWKDQATIAGPNR